MTFPQVTVEQWRAQVEKELAGASFEKTLVTRTPEGLAIAPLYTERPGDGPRRARPAARTGGRALSRLREGRRGRGRGGGRDRGWRRRDLAARERAPTR